MGWIWSPDVGVECKGYLRWESQATNRNFDLVFLLLCFALTAYSSKEESTYSSVVWSHRKQDYDQNLIRCLVRTEQGRMFWKIYMRKRRIPQGNVVPVRASCSSGAAVVKRGLVRCLGNELRNFCSDLPSMSPPPAHGDP